MQTKILNQLIDLRKNSNKRLAKNIVHGFQGYVRSSGLRPIQLVDPVLIANSNWTYKPVYGTNSLSQYENRHAIRKIRTLTAGQENNFTFNLNSSLLGGT